MKGFGMLIIVKLFLAIVLVALAAQQLSMYYSVVVVGSYMTTAPIHLQIITGGLWPLVVIVLGLWLLWKLIKFKPSDLG